MNADDFEEFAQLVESTIWALEDFHSFLTHEDRIEEDQAGTDPRPLREDRQRHHMNTSAVSSSTPPCLEGGPDTTIRMTPEGGSDLVFTFCDLVRTRPE
jgi:hypothetical protein